MSAWNPGLDHTFKPGSRAGHEQMERTAIAAASGPVMGVLARELRVRVLNCSPSGCLLETNAPMEIGTVGSLQLEIEGRQLLDHLVVVRCQPIAGAGSLYHVGARFLWIGPSTQRTVRQVFGQPELEPVGRQ